MLDTMSADEFVAWGAFERMEPFGHPWADWVQAHLQAQIDWTKSKKERSDYRMPSDLRYKPPEPLYVTRQRKAAARRKENRKKNV